MVRKVGVSSTPDQDLLVRHLGFQAKRKKSSAIETKLTRKLSRTYSSSRKANRVQTSKSKDPLILESVKEVQLRVRPVVRDPLLQVGVRSQIKLLLVQVHG